MSAELLIVLVLLGVTIVLFALNRPRMDAVALIMLTLLPLTGVITVEQALAGFSDPSIVLIAALFVIGEALVRTGVAQRLGDWLIDQAGRSETRLIALLMVMVAGIGSFMSSTGVVAIFIPVALRIAHGAGLAPGRLMMPLSVAGLISGMMTLIATPPNVVIHSELQRAGYEGFAFFAFTPFGVPILALAIGYMLLARRWLGRRPAAEAAEAGRPRVADWIAEYRLAEREHRLRLLPRSPWVGKRLAQLDLRASAGVNVIAIERRQPFATVLVEPNAQTELEVGDVLLLDVREPAFDLQALCEHNGLQRLPLPRSYFADHAQAIGMAELMIPAESSLIGKTVVDASFRTTYGLSVIGLKRGRTAYPESVLNERLRLGDTLLVAGPWRAIRALQGRTRDLIVLNMPVESEQVLAAPGRAPHALAALALMVLLMTTGVVPNVLAALIACLLLGLFRCIDMDSAYGVIHWRSLMLIAGMLPFSLALQATGGVSMAAEALLGAVGDAGPRTMLAALFVLTAVAGLFISNTATAVLMAPVALAVAEEMGLSPYPFAMTVALAASASFMTPVSSPVNTLVIGPGNYRFIDFVRVGVPFAVIVLAMTVALVPLLFPFRP